MQGRKCVDIACMMTTRPLACLSTCLHPECKLRQGRQPLQQVQINRRSIAIANSIDRELADMRRHPLLSTLSHPSPCRPTVNSATVDKSGILSTIVLFRTRASCEDFPGRRLYPVPLTGERQPSRCQRQTQSRWVSHLALGTCCMSDSHVARQGLRITDDPGICQTTAAFSSPHTDRSAGGPGSGPAESWPCSYQREVSPTAACQLQRSAHTAERDHACRPH